MFTALGLGDNETPFSADAATRPRESSAASSDNEDHERAKRRRVTRACDICKSRKRRCTGEQPCSFCADHGSRCTYDSPYARGKPSLAHQANLSVGGFRPVNIVDHSVPAQTPQRHRSIGSLANSGSAVRNNAAVSSNRSPQPDGVMQPGQYLGPTSPISFIRRASKRFGSAHTNNIQDDAGPDISMVKFGDRKFPNLEISRLPLPGRDQGKTLIARYFEFAAPTYRFLHKPTVSAWFERMYETDDAREAMLPVRRAIVLLVLATAMMYNVDESPTSSRPSAEDERTEEASEKLFQAAQDMLDRETGAARLESVQARLAATLYLLNTSRLNQSWYLFGLTYQLIVALGLHRRGAGRQHNAQQDFVAHECRKRSYWTAYTLDGYFSVMLGRPPMINEEYSDQDYPQQVNDEDISAEHISDRPKSIDCFMAAPVLHAKLAQIVRKASRDHYLLHSASEDRQIRFAARLNHDIQNWRQELPVFLSGAIHPFSLIPTFRRQLTVLRIASVHAVMLANRPLMLSRTAPLAEIQPFIDECLSAAKQALDMVMEFVAGNELLPAFWNTQFVAFNALSIVYVWITQRKTGRLLSAQHRYDELLELAETVQKHLAAVTQRNAPNLQYGVILAELQQEARRAVDPSVKNEAQGPALSPEHLPSAAGTSAGEADTGGIPGNPAGGEYGDLDLPLDPSLWLQLDSFPFTNNLSFDGQDVPATV